MNSRRENPIPALHDDKVDPLCDPPHRPNQQNMTIWGRGQNRDVMSTAHSSRYTCILPNIVTLPRFHRQTPPFLGILSQVVRRGFQKS